MKKQCPSMAIWRIVFCHSSLSFVFGGNIERNSLLVKRHSQAACSSPNRSDCPSVPKVSPLPGKILIRISPDHTFAAGRLQLSVIHRLSVWCDHDIGIIKCRRHSVPPEYPTLTYTECSFAQSTILCISAHPPGSNCHSKSSSPLFPPCCGFRR